ncbi:MAG TPA: cobalamin-dependent protein, partial [Candidatus Kapabacteria bacterium]|nr:cobalamin-dependent protein [Candidatus Kapabacteria bacterium]
LNYLAEAVGADQPDLFADYVLWAKFMLQGRGVPAEDLIENLKILREVIAPKLSAAAEKQALKCIDAGLAQLEVAGAEAKTSELSIELPCRITQDNPHCELATNYLNALLRGDRHEASRMIMSAVDAGVSVKELYLHVFQPAQHEVGRLWQINVLTVAQEHYCTAATQLIMSQLYPHIFSTRKNGRAMVATCVSGDLHEIGVRMISDFFEMEGWDTFYLGANVPVDSVVSSIKDREADLLAVSATMTFHVGAVRKLIAAIRADEETKQTKIIVGGYPFNLAPTLWKEIGADGHALDAERSLSLAEELLKT